MTQKQLTGFTIERISNERLDIFCCSQNSVSGPYPSSLKDIGQWIHIPTTFMFDHETCENMVARVVKRGDSLSFEVHLNTTLFYSFNFNFDLELEDKKTFMLSDCKSKSGYTKMLSVDQKNGTCLISELPHNGNNIIADYEIENFASSCSKNNIIIGNDIWQIGPNRFYRIIQGNITTMHKLGKIQNMSIELTFKTTCLQNKLTIAIDFSENFETIYMIDLTEANYQGYTNSGHFSYIVVPDVLPNLINVTDEATIDLDYCTEKVVEKVVEKVPEFIGINVTEIYDKWNITCLPNGYIGYGYYKKNLGKWLDLPELCFSELVIKSEKVKKMSVIINNGSLVLHINNKFIYNFPFYNHELPKSYYTESDKKLFIMTGPGNQGKSLFPEMVNTLKEQSHQELANTIEERAQYSFDTGFYDNSFREIYERCNGVPLHKDQEKRVFQCMFDARNTEIANQHLKFKNGFRPSAEQQNKDLDNALSIAAVTMGKAIGFEKIMVEEKSICEKIAELYLGSYMAKYKERILDYLKTVENDQIEINEYDIKRGMNISLHCQNSKIDLALRQAASKLSGQLYDEEQIGKAYRLANKEKAYRLVIPDDQKKDVNVTDMFADYKNSVNGTKHDWYYSYKKAENVVDADSNKESSNDESINKEFLTESLTDYQKQIIQQAKLLSIKLSEYTVVPWVEQAYANFESLVSSSFTEKQAFSVLMIVLKPLMEAVQQKCMDSLEKSEFGTYNSWAKLLQKLAQEQMSHPLLDALLQKIHKKWKGNRIIIGPGSIQEKALLMYNYILEAVTAGTAKSFKDKQSLDIWYNNCVQRYGYN